MTPTQIAKLISETTAVGPRDELATHLTMRANFKSEQNRNLWLNLIKLDLDFITGVTIKYVDTDIEISKNELLDDEEEFQIVIGKKTSANNLYLFFGDSLKKNQDALPNKDVIFVADIGTTDTFSTYRNRFTLWTEDAVSDYPPVEPLSDPRKYSRDFTGSAAVPDDIRPWLIRSKPETQSTAYEAWRSLASRKLIAVVAEQVSKGPSGITYHFTGPPKVAVSVSDEELLNAYEHLDEGARWIFLEGDGHIETRHIFLALEWARSYRQDASEPLGKDCLESARVGYSASVKSSSRDTIKAIADLRKNVFDEALKASQKSQELGAALWKDLAIASIPLLAKITLDAAKSEDNTLVLFLAIFAIAFLLFSFGFQVYVNKKFFQTQKNAHKILNNKIYTIFSKSELEEISDAPIQKSIKNYRNARYAVGFFYVLIIVGLSWLAYTARANGPKIETMRQTLGMAASHIA